MTHFLQSTAWASFQKKLGRTTITDSGDGWSYTAIVEKGTLNRRLYTPYGPVCASEESFLAAQSSLIAKAKEQHATFLRIEPTEGVTVSTLKKHGWKPVTYQSLQPSHTQVIDLSGSTDEILANMSQNSRNITRNYHKKGISITASSNPQDITILTSLLKQVARRNRITTQSDSYLKTQAETLMPIGAAVLYVARFENTPIAASLVYDSDTTRYYAHAAADDSYRKLSAGTALVGQMILDAKEKGLTHFDLYGITTSSNPSHPWHGFTKFKQSFGGTSLSYVGAWDLPIATTGYWVYRIYQSLRRKLR